MILVSNVNNSKLNQGFLWKTSKNIVYTAYFDGLTISKIDILQSEMLQKTRLKHEPSKNSPRHLSLFDRGIT